MSKIGMEICAYNIESAMIAQDSIANRVELCAGPAEGGTTPGPGTIKLARKFLTIDLFVMIRPRGGDFLYNENEFETMIQDIIFAKSAGADGVVLGLLNSDGTVDRERTSKLVETAYPLKVTFHRAFDLTPDPFQALETIITTGAERILTSGQKPTAMQGAALIAGLNRFADGKIAIMAGSGINDANATELISATGVKEIHLSAKKYFPSGMLFRNPDVAMGSAESDEYAVLKADGAMITRIAERIRNAF